METSAIAAAAVSQGQSQVQSAVAAKILKMNAEAGQQIAAVLEQAVEQGSALADGVGGNLDIQA